MPTFSGNLQDVVGTAANGRIEIRASQPRKVDGAIVGTGTAILKVTAGVIEARTVKPGPVDVYIQVGSWSQLIENVVVPDASTADFWDVIESSITYEPGVVSQVRADRIAAEAAAAAAAASAASVPANVATQLADRYTKSQSDGRYAATAHTHPIADITATGTKDSTTYLRGDGTWAVPAGSGGSGTPADGSLTTAKYADDSVTSTKVSPGIRTSLGKADTALQSAPVTSVASKTGAVSLAKSDVGLSNVDNTSDAAKPVSTATQTALDARYTKTEIDAAAGDTVGFDSGAGTRKLAAGLQKAFSNTGSCDIVLVGDSMTTAYTGAAFDFANPWYRKLKSALVAGGAVDGGSGFVACTQGDPTAIDPRWVIGANWDKSNYGYILSSAAGATATFSSDVAGTSVEVTYGNTGNPFTVSIDGGTAVTVTPTGSPTIKVYSVTGLSNTLHTVTIVGQQYAALVGVQVKGTNGLRMHSVGKFGITAAAFADNTSLIREIATTAIPSPTAIVIQLGANDLTASGATPAATVDKIRLIRQLWPNADAILAVEPQTTTEVTAAVWNDFETRVRALGVELSAPVVDIHRRWGGSTSAGALGFVGVDGKHPNIAGQTDVAALYLSGFRRVYPTTHSGSVVPVTRSVPFCFEMCQQSIGRTANEQFQLRRPFRLPIKPTRFRIHFANRIQLSGAFVTGTAGDLVGLRVALGKPTVNATTGEPTGAWASPIEVMAATNVANGNIQSTPWIDPATHGLNAGDMFLLGYSFTASASSPQVSYNGGLNWQTSAVADLMSTSVTGTRANNACWLQVIIEIEHTDAGANHLLIVGNSLSGPSAGGVYDNYGELGTYHQQWAMRTRNFASSIAVAGSYASAYATVNSKWNVFDNFNIPYVPDVVLYYASASSDVADSTSDTTTNDIKTNMINVIKSGRSKYPTARQWLTDIPPRVAFTGDKDTASANEGQRHKLNQWLHMLPVQTEQCLNVDALFSDWANPARLRPVFTTDGTHGSRIFHDLAAGGIHLGRKVNV